MKSQKQGSISPIQTLLKDDDHPAAQAVKRVLLDALSALGFSGIASGALPLEHPADPAHGDYASAIALALIKHPQVKEKFSSPRMFAQAIADGIKNRKSPDKTNEPHVENVTVEGPGFINIWLSVDFLIEQAADVKKGTMPPTLTGRKIMVEFAHPNPLKEFHIGHLRNITLGESIVRILESCGATMFRANYEADVGMHTAKALWGARRKLKADSLELLDVQKRTPQEKANFLGQAYALGSAEFEKDETAKQEIIALNKMIYKDPKAVDLWEETRQWSLDYFQQIYRRVGSRFDRLIFESEVEVKGRQLVKDGVKKGIFVKDPDGSIYFPGEKFGLNNCVFVTREDYATYEGKEVALEQLEYQLFPFDLDIHVVANEQINFFQIAFEAVAQYFPEQRGKQYHLAYGMVKLKSGKMSSRTGEVITADWLIDEAKKKLAETFKGLSLEGADTEKIAVAAVKYSMLRVNPKQDIAFDLNESVTLEGDSGPYLQYVYARCRSVLRKAEKSAQSYQLPATRLASRAKRASYQLNDEESLVLRTIARFPEVVAEAAKTLSPNNICTYLFDLAAKYNTFYNKHHILASREIPNPKSQIPNNENPKTQDPRPKTEFRLFLTDATSQVIKQGLHLLGIETVERM